MFRFVTELRTTATPVQIHDTMLRPEAWATRWTDALAIERRADGDADGAGARLSATVRAPAGYTISAEVAVTEASRGSHIVARLTGDLVGQGTWTFRADGDTAIAHLDMTARTTRLWMGAAARLARPVLEWSHGAVMRHAAQAATEHLDAELLAFRSDPVRN